jgi:hypothetical protein
MNDTVREMGWCLQALYSRNGEPRPWTRARRVELLDNRLLFIQMVYTFRQFQANGLLRHALDAFNRGLGQLPEWFAFRGSLVLVPSPPVGDRGRVWRDTDDAEVERILRDVYHRRGAYEVWCDSVNVRRTAITVMGRVVP